jgi:nucleotide-binding universal stress UspA family protein
MGEAIVVGTDGSETAQRAVAEAVRVARALGAELHIVTAYGMRASPLVANVPDVAALMMAALPDSEAESIVERAAATPRSDGLNVHTHAVEGDPGDALIAVASHVGARTIVVGSRGMSGARQLLGSVPNRVSHAAACNVMIVSTGERRGR